ncbi:uncharacterized protein BO96DRAFT_407161 [Aspergillus niger CBS 101883]|uniref:uncharacterized protein n=1 Tax=Aspergillus lacticoffeatus (strain CBS 101883) TaxID=1450533 RepID=UPI000D7EBAE5|nr:uncharacterized protein BO96DRAFT_407161 [Aspergillus niger CBS 101883]PYH62541.1 hypothetical protein BO96DRAFT_407161 [Aspergillus niger CBS 101883]
MKEQISDRDRRKQHEWLIAQGWIVNLAGPWRHPEVHQQRMQASTKKRMVRRADVNRRSKQVYQR